MTIIAYFSSKWFSVMAKLKFCIHSETSGLFHQADANVEKQGHHPEKATDRLTIITKGFEKNTGACNLQSLNLITPLL